MPKIEESCSLRKHYGFEEIIRPEEAALFDENDNYYNIFRDNLRLNVVCLDPDATKLLRRYVAAVHINACWYNRKVKSQVFWRGVFFVASVVLLLATPIAVYCLPELLSKWLNNSSTDNQEAAALLSTSLAGFYGAHRAVSAWFSQTKLIAPYWKARSELMNEIYTLETQWRAEPKTTSSSSSSSCLSLCDAFRDAIVASLSKAREIVETERDTFFNNYSPPDVNIAKELVASAKEASAIVASFTSPSVTKRRKQAEAIEELLSDQHGIATGRAELEKAKSEMTKVLEEYPDESEERTQRIASLKEVTDALDKIIDAQAKNRIDLAKARARIT